MSHTIAKAAGVIFIVLGILGFIPGVTQEGGYLFGLFHVNPVHNWFHILTGVIALIAGYNGIQASKVFFQIFGVIYALMALLGFVYQGQPIFGVIANNLADAWLHTFIAIFSLIVGFAPERRMVEMKPNP